MFDQCNITLVTSHEELSIGTPTGVYTQYSEKTDSQIKQDKSK